MSSYENRIENSLRRADELIQSGQTKLAYGELTTLVSRKMPWSDTVEKIYQRYLHLSVEFKKASDAKFALNQFRSISQVAHIKSLDQMTSFFLDTAEKKVASVERETTAMVDELESRMEDEELWPENLMMAAVAGEDFKDRTDRQYLAPWLSFQWHAYRGVLDVLKTMSTMEHRYHDTVSRALNFCKRHNNRHQLRQLSETLHNHLLLAQKISASNLKRLEEDSDSTSYTQAMSNKINILNYNTVNMLIETRFKILSTAMEMEIWQEAFKAIEDIHLLMNISKHEPKTAFMIAYFEQLAKLFWVSKNYLLHAFSNLKCFELLQHAQHVSSNEVDYSGKIRTMATAVILSTITLAPSKSDNLSRNADIAELDFREREILIRLSSLLGTLSELPSKEQLISRANYVARFAHPQVQALPNLFFKSSSSPFTFHSQVTQALDFAQRSTKEGYQIYTDALIDATCITVLEKLNEVYDVMKISEVVALCPGPISQQKLESLIMESTQQRRKMQVTIDHQKGVILFGILGSIRNSAFDSDNIRSQLAHLAKHLQSIAGSIERQTGHQIISRRSPLVPLTSEQADKEHKDFLARREFIVKKTSWEGQEQSEREHRIANFRKERDEEREKLAKKKKEEEERLREELRAAREAHQEKVNKAKLFIEKLSTQTKIPKDILVKKLAAAAGARIKKKHSNKSSLEDEAATVVLESTSIMQTLESILQAHEEEQTREKQQKEKKKAELIRSMDYLERARREMEARRVEEEYEKRKKEDKKLFEKTNQKEREMLEAKRKLQQEKYDYFSKMKEFKEIFVEEHVMSVRREKYNKEIQEQNERKERERTRWEKKRELIRKEIAREKAEEEEERRKKEEEREAFRRQEEMQQRKVEEMEARAEAQKQEALTKEAQRQESVPQQRSRWGNFGSETAPPSFGRAASVGTGDGERRWGRTPTTPISPTGGEGRWGSTSQSSASEGRWKQSSQSSTSPISPTGGESRWGSTSQSSTSESRWRQSSQSSTSESRWKQRTGGSSSQGRW